MEDTPRINQENYEQALEKMKKFIEDIETQIEDKVSIERRLTEEALQKADSEPSGTHFFGNLSGDLEVIESDIEKLRAEKMSILREFVSKWEK